MDRDARAGGRVTLPSALAVARFGWAGVCATGAALGVAALIFFAVLVARRRDA